MSTKKRIGFSAAVLCILSMGAAGLFAQRESPFIPEKLALILGNEISGDRAFNTVRLLTPFHRIMGSHAYLDAAAMLSGLADKAGLKNLRTVNQKFEGMLSWDVRSAQLWMTEPEEIKLADFDDVAVSLAVFSRSAHLSAELVDIGRGATAEDFAGLDVKGKVVLTTATPSRAVVTAVWGRGALGVISCGSIHPGAKFDTPDQIAYIKVPASVPEGKTAPWAFMISARRYDELQTVLRNAKARNKSVKVRVDIDTEIHEPTEQAYLWGEIEGSDIHDQDIILTAHLDEESTSANDNGSGCGSQLEVGRAINALIKSGRIAHPKRDIIFWWPNEHTSEYQHIREHPEDLKNWLVNINQDMVGARQSIGSRAQHVIRTPYSIPSYLSDVIESIAEHVITANNGSRASEDGGVDSPALRPLLSFLGSRESYTASVVPYSTGSDQDVFVDGIIGIPGVALINYPDSYVHSSDDDLWNIDRTQLKRNAYIVAAATLFLAGAGDADVPLLAGEVYGRGVKRLGNDLRTALNHVRTKKAGDLDLSYEEARNLIDQAVLREKKALESILVFAVPGGKNAAYVKARVSNMEAVGADLAEELEAAYFLVSGSKKLPRRALTPDEIEMSRRIPVNIESIDEYFSKRDWMPGAKGLSGVIVKECFSFVDGKRSCLDIYRAVHAEALSVGAHVYGTVALSDVKALLDDAVEKGILKLKK